MQPHRKSIGWLGLFLTVLLLAPYLSSSAQQQSPTEQFLPIIHTTPPRYPPTRIEVTRDGTRGQWAVIRVYAPDSTLSITATVIDRTIELRPDYDYFGDPVWIGYLSLEGLEKRVHTATIQAADALGPLAKQQVNFFYNPLPLATVHTPQAYDVAQPSMQLYITCEDESACVSMEVRDRRWGTLLASTQGNVLSQTISFEDHIGEIVGLEVIVTDDDGESNNTFNPYNAPTVSLFVAPSSLRQVAQVPGFIRDVTTSHLLYVGNLGTDIVRFHPTGGTLKLYDRLTGQSVDIAQNEFCVIDKWKVALFSQGVLFRECEIFSQTPSLYEWRAGEVEELARLYGLGFLSVEGDYAVWSEGEVPPDPMAAPLYFLRNLQSKTTHRLTEYSITPWLSETPLDIAANGDVVYTYDVDQHSHLFRWREGVHTRLTPSNISWYPVGPKTDGTSILYTKVEGLWEPQQSKALMLLTPAGEVQLLPPFQDNQLQYDINDGWVSYEMPVWNSEAADSVGPIWVRSPAGEVQQLTTLGRILSWGPKGELIYKQATGSQGSYHLFVPGHSPMSIDLGPPYQSRFFWVEGRPYVAVHNTLFQIPFP